MSFGCKVSAQEKIKHIGYYRLSAYWFQFKAKEPDGTNTGSFRQGTNFDDIYSLYIFDRQLRLLLLDAIERIEVSIRTVTSLEVGKHDRWAYRDPKNFNQGFLLDRKTGKKKHEEWLKKFDAKFSTSQERYAKHFNAKYFASPPPIWIVLEHLEFGALSFLIGGLQRKFNDQIARHYGLTRGDIFVSWIRSISVIRNICAHHGRLWNRNIAVKPLKPKLLEVPNFDHVERINRVYAILVCIQHFLLAMNEGYSWSEMLRSHIFTFPSTFATKIEDAGFPVGWDTQQVWVKNEAEVN